MKLNRALISIAVMITGLLLAESGAFGAESKARREGKVTKEDSNFVREAASGGMMEVQLGKIAEEKAASSAVKEFGERMQKDHGKANQELKKIASDKGIKVPAKLESKHQSMLERVSKTKGDRFDREYMDTMVKAHKEDLKKFQRQADKGDDPELRKFANEHVPILEKHLSLAEKTQKQIGAARKAKTRP